MRVAVVRSVLLRGALVVACCLLLATFVYWLSLVVAVLFVVCCLLLVICRCLLFVVVRVVAGLLFVGDVCWSLSLAGVYHCRGCVLFVCLQLFVVRCLLLVD